MNSQNNGQPYWMAFSFLLIGLVVGLVINNGGIDFNRFVPEDNTEVEEPTLEPDQLQTVSVNVDDDPVLGDPNAPVTIVEFSDFQCPYCRTFYKESYELLKEEYIDTGIVKLVYRDFPLPSHGDASLAAQAAECARKITGKDSTYFAMHDLLFENQSLWSNAEEAKSIIEGLANSLEGATDNSILDISSCLDSEEMKAEVEADYTAGRSYGVSGTPTFFINGKKLVGAWPYDVFQKVIESVR